MARVLVVSDDGTIVVPIVVGLDEDGDGGVPGARRPGR